MLTTTHRDRAIYLALAHTRQRVKLDTGCTPVVLIRWPLRTPNSTATLSKRLGVGGIHNDRTPARTKRNCGTLCEPSVFGHKTRSQRSRRSLRSVVTALLLVVTTSVKVKKNRALELDWLTDRAHERDLERGPEMIAHLFTLTCVTRRHRCVLGWRPYPCGKGWWGDKPYDLFWVALFSIAIGHCHGHVYADCALTPTTLPTA